MEISFPPYYKAGQFCLFLTSYCITRCCPLLSIHHSKNSINVWLVAHIGWKWTQWREKIFIAKRVQGVFSKNLFFDYCVYALKLSRSQVGLNIFQGWSSSLWKLQKSNTIRRKSPRLTWQWRHRFPRAWTSRTRAPTLSNSWWRPRTRSSCCAGGPSDGAEKWRQATKHFSPSKNSHWFNFANRWKGYNFDYSFCISPHARLLGKLTHKSVRNKKWLRLLRLHYGKDAIEWKRT